MIEIIEKKATKEQIDRMMQTLGTYIKLAVDIELGILSGGGVLHADCESVLLENGSQQENIWGADWNPSSQQVTFESLINIRPRQNNPSLEVLDPEIRQQISEITLKILGGI